MGLSVGVNQVQWNALAAGVLCIVMAMIVVYWAQAPVSKRGDLPYSKHLQYQQHVEYRYQLRLASILSSFLDASDVKIQVNIDLDFATIPAQIKRLIVVVILNDQPLIDTDRLAQLTQLLEQAVGIDQARGDSLSITRLPFHHSVMDTLSPLLIKQLLTGILLFGLMLMLKSVVQRCLGASNAGIIREPAPATSEETPVSGNQSTSADPLSPMLLARQMADQDPRHVAQVVKLWMAKDV